MSERLVIIDGKSVFYRGYYAMPNLSTKDGTPTGGVYGFAVMALEVIKRLKPTYVCVAWDKRHTNIRSRLALYPQYKAGRKAAPDDFYEQVPILHELLKSLNWPLYEADDYEADDLMGAFAKQAGEKGIQSYLVTSDLDVLQLVNAHTHIYTLKKGLSNIELFNEASFKEKYGVDAHQWVDVKALKGDSSDNIPGVAGIGEKTALELIAQYKTLDGVYENLDLLKPALKAKLEKDKDIAYLSRKLVTLMVDAPIKIDLEEARLHAGLLPAFAAMLRKLEFKTLLRQVESELSAEEAAKAKVIPPEKQLPPLQTVAFDRLTFKEGQPRVAALSPDATQLWLSTDAAHVSTIAVSELTKNILTNIANGPLVGHDLKSLFRALLAHDLSWPGTVGHDARIGAFLLDPLQRSRELTDILERPLNADDPGEIIAAIRRAYQDQLAAFAKLPNLTKLAHEIEFPSIYMLAKVEHRGILLNSEYLRIMSRQFEKKIAIIERRIYAQAGQEFNIGSPSQLGTILYEKLGLPTQGVKKGKSGGYSTGANELAKLRGLHPIADAITEYREYTKLKSTYIDALPKLVDKDGRLHTTFALDVAATGRLSSRDPNLQNIPTRTELGQAIRTAFVPAEGNVFVGADYSQFELRLAAIMAGDTKLIEDFNQDVDIHTKTAAEIYNIPLEEVDKNQRRHAKMVNFAVLYGMSAHGLSVATGMSIIEARNFITTYFELRKPIREYIDRTLKQGLEEGYVETMFGRRRPTPDLKSSNFVVREAAKRVAANMPIQGTEADLMKLAMLEVEKKLDGLGDQILQIHDSILVETPKENAEKVATLLKETMENIYKLPVKLAVDVKIGPNWGAL
ncbi:MAG TPA: DNA polymerase I [Candidatus Saccharimonadales bacterium]|nr:DNA polymerase I [Candidatus Saccharimonadales bacterium]